MPIKSMSIDRPAPVAPSPISESNLHFFAMISLALDHMQDVISHEASTFHGARVPEGHTLYTSHAQQLQVGIRCELE